MSPSGDERALIGKSGKRRRCPGEDGFLHVCAGWGADPGRQAAPNERFPASAAPRPVGSHSVTKLVVPGQRTMATSGQIPMAANSAAPR